MSIEELAVECAKAAKEVGAALNHLADAKNEVERKRHEYREAKDRLSEALEALVSRDCNPHAEGTALFASWNAGWKGVGDD